MTAPRQSGEMSLAVTQLPSVADVLRGDRSRRPLSDHFVAAGLRHDLEDWIYRSNAPRATVPATLLHAGDLRDLKEGSVLTSGPTARLRGILVGQLLRLLVVGHHLDDPFGDAVAAWRSVGAASSLLEVLDRLDHEERARLATDVTAHAVTLVGRLGDIPTGWRPRSNVRASQRFATGAVVVKDHFDLVVGSSHTTHASVALLDITTSPLTTFHEKLLRYHALVQTLLVGVAPLRAVILSTATNDLWSVDVDGELLRRALDDMCCALERKWST